MNHHYTFSDEERLVDTIKQEISLCDTYISRQALAYLMGMTRETLCRKINDPERLKLSDLLEIASLLGKSLHIYFD